MCTCRSGVAGGDPGDVELRRVVLRSAGRLLLRRLVQECPVAPRPPVAALAGAVSGGAVVVTGEEAVHADPRGRRAATSRRPGRLLQAPERTLRGGGGEGRGELAAVL